MLRVSVGQKFKVWWQHVFHCFSMANYDYIVASSSSPSVAPVIHRNDFYLHIRFKITIGRTHTQQNQMVVLLKVIFYRL